MYHAPDCSAVCCSRALFSCLCSALPTTTTITTHTRWSPLRLLVAASATAAGAATGAGVAAGAAASGAGAAAAAAAAVVTVVTGRTVAAAAAAAVAQTSTLRTPPPSPLWVEGFRVVGCWRGLKPCGRGHGGSLSAEAGLPSTLGQGLPATARVDRATAAAPMELQLG